MPIGSASWTAIAALLVGGYLLGSVSFAWLLACLRGVDLRSVGSGNLGATNAGRALGRPYGVLVYLLDALKGWAPAQAGLLWKPEEPWVAVAGAGGAVIGHVFPVFLRFRGGKGVATLSGTLIALAPWALLLSVPPFVLIVLLTRYMSLGSLFLGVSIPGLAWLSPELGVRAAPYPQPVLYYCLVAGAFILFTHRSNVRRLLAGEENRLGGRKRGEAHLD